jgi:hypothetical protein
MRPENYVINKSINELLSKWYQNNEEMGDACGIDGRKIRTQVFSNTKQKL